MVLILKLVLYGIQQARRLRQTLQEDDASLSLAPSARAFSCGSPLRDAKWQADHGVGACENREDGA